MTEESKHNQSQRRAFFRAAYPASNGLKILNMDVEVLDICQNSLRFCSSNNWDKFSKAMENNDILEVSVLFHDNTVENIKGHITNCYANVSSKKQDYVLTFIKEIPFKKISTEQSYLLKHFPDFSRYLFGKSTA